MISHARRLQANQQPPSLKHINLCAAERLKWEIKCLGVFPTALQILGGVSVITNR